MWGNLAGQINKQSGGLLTKIGEVVAPVLDDHVEYTDSEEEFDDDNYYEEEDDDGNSYHQESGYVDFQCEEYQIDQKSSQLEEETYSRNDDFLEDDGLDEEVNDSSESIFSKEIQSDGITTRETKEEKSNSNKNQNALLFANDISQKKLVSNENDLDQTSFDIDDSNSSDMITNEEITNQLSTSSSKGDMLIESRAPNSSIEDINAAQKSPCRQEERTKTVMVSDEQDIVLDYTDQSLGKSIPVIGTNEASSRFAVTFAENRKLQDIDVNSNQNVSRTSKIDGDSITKDETERDDRFAFEIISNLSTVIESNAQMSNRADDVVQALIDDKPTNYGKLSTEFDEKSRLLVTSYEKKLSLERQKFEREKEKLQNQIEHARKNAKNESDQSTIERDSELAQLKKLVEKANLRAEIAEKECVTYAQAEKKAISESRQSIKSLKDAEIKVQQLSRILDERNYEIDQLKKSSNDMRSMLSIATTENHQMERENVTLKNEVDQLKNALDEAHTNLDEQEGALVALENENSDMSGLQMELRLLKESHKREVDEMQMKIENLSSSSKIISTERDTALQEATDIERKLTQALADLQLSQNDYERVLASCENMQRAIEAFQSERDAELTLLNEQRLEAEAALKAAHEASLEALRQSNTMRMQEVERASNEAVKNSMNEISKLEQCLEKAQHENEYTRKSLDEAIKRLQVTQEDVIDRSIMKNILLDWISKGEKERHEVLKVMTSLLHFSEDEKKRVGLFEYSSSGLAGRVVGAVAVPLPPSKLNIDKIEGDDLREKWVNFLMAESSSDDLLTN